MNMPASRVRARCAPTAVHAAPRAAGASVVFAALLSALLLATACAVDDVRVVVHGAVARGDAAWRTRVFAAGDASCDALVFVHDPADRLSELAATTTDGATLELPRAGDKLVFVEQLGGGRVVARGCAAIAAASAARGLPAVVDVTLAATHRLVARDDAPGALANDAPVALARTVDVDGEVASDVDVLVRSVRADQSTTTEVLHSDADGIVAVSPAGEAAGPVSWHVVAAHPADEDDVTAAAFRTPRESAAVPAEARDITPMRLASGPAFVFVQDDAASTLRALPPDDDGSGVRDLAVLSDFVDIVGAVQDARGDDSALVLGSDASLHLVNEQARHDAPPVDVMHSWYDVAVVDVGACPGDAPGDALALVTALDERDEPVAALVADDGEALQVRALDGTFSDLRVRASACVPTTDGRRVRVISADGEAAPVLLRADAITASLDADALRSLARVHTDDATALVGADETHAYFVSLRDDGLALRAGVIDGEALSFAGASVSVPTMPSAVLGGALFGSLADGSAADGSGSSAPTAAALPTVDDALALLVLLEEESLVGPTSTWLGVSVGGAGRVSARAPTTALGAHSGARVLAADVDGDGVLDVLATAGREGEPPRALTLHFTSRR